MANNDKFRAAIAKRIAKTKGKFELIVQKLTMAIDESIIYKSPVDTGHFVHNWHIGNGAIDTTVLEGANPDKKAIIERNEALISSLKVNGQVIYITNSVIYSYRLEYEGWSKQAPQGMVRTTLAELNSILNGVAHEVKSK